MNRRWDEVVDTLDERFPEAAPSMRDARPDVLTFASFPPALWRKIWSNNPLERSKKEISVARHAIPITSLDLYGRGTVSVGCWASPSTKGRTLDRREALKRIGVGGAAVAGASMVMSSPAFAYDLPSGVVDSVVSFNPQAQIVGVRITSNASAECNASAAATFPNARIDSRTITATSLAMEDGYQWQASNDLVGVTTRLDEGDSVSSVPDTSGNPPIGTSAVGRMRKVVTDTDTTANIIGGDSFRIEVVTVLACEYTGDTKTVTRTTTAVYTA